MKKVLSFVLILALVLGSFSFAFGLTDVVKGDANSEAIKVADDLGIVEGYPDGSFKPDQDVTRAEFAAMITRALDVPVSALAGFSSTSFKDTSGYGWAVKYLAFCESKGIMIGDGYGNVMPGRTINVNEAMTMVLRAVGYTENSAVLVGTWPSKYVTLAQNLGLYDDVAATVMVDRGNAAQVIYNALTVVKVQVAADGATTNVTGDPTMLDNLGASFWKEDADGKNIFSVYTTADADASVINTRDYVGAYVKAYVNSDEEVIAIAEVNSIFLTGTYDSTEGEFTANGVDYTVAKTTMAATYDDGKLGALYGVNGYIDSAVTIASITNTAIEYTIAAKVTGKTIKQVYSVQEWDAEDAFLFEADLLDDKTLNGHDFTLDDNDNIDTNTFALLGVSSLADIAKDNVVSVYLDSRTSKEIVRVEVGTKTVTGKVTYIKDDDNYTIGGKVYEFTLNANDFPGLGDEGTAYINYNGKIAYWDADSTASENYAIVTATFAAVGRDDTIILLDKTGLEKEYVVDSAAATSAAGITKGALVVFDLEKSGKVDMISFVDVKNDTTAKLNKAKTIFTSPNQGSKLVDAGVVVFVWDGNDYTLGSFADIEADNSMVATSAAVDGKIKALVVKSDAVGADAIYAVINSAEERINADDETVQYVEGFANNADYTAYTDNKNKFGSTVTFGAVSISKLTVDSNGVIVKVQEFDKSSGVTGYAVTKDGNYLIQVGSTSAGSVTTWCAIDSKAVVYEFKAGTSGSKDMYSKGSLSSIKGKTTTTGTSVQLYQVDKDSAFYDFVVIVK